ncbi:MAG: hypothetical protein GY741_12500 [Phycisphaeraceae bacterium]|nr:hypothetical protein [Phycisphaeraceae bacterium]
MEAISSIDAIRAAWRPLNEAHRAGRRFSDGAHLRLYRCLSWADRATAAEATGDADLAFVLRMIAFNALWGQVHVDGGRNLRQSEAWRSFLSTSRPMTRHDAIGCFPDFDGIVIS